MVEINDTSKYAIMLYKCEWPKDVAVVTLIINKSNNIIKKLIDLLFLK